MSREHYYLCNKCKEWMFEGWPIIQHGKYYYCPDCAYILGIINTEEYLRNHCGGHIAKYVGVNLKGQIEWWNGKPTPPWLRPKKAQRTSPYYSAWRRSVFERDKFTCNLCGQIGGELNVPHIKSFSNYPDLRYDPENAITVCVSCHKQIHRERGRK